MQPQEAENILNSLVRLKRQYEINVQGFDKPALLEMSQVLRHWVEMKEYVDAFLTTKQITFNGYQLNTSFKQYLRRNGPYILCYFLPNGVRVPDGRLLEFVMIGDNNTATGVSLKRYRYNSWMSSEIVRMSFLYENEMRFFRLTCEELIRKLANAHGGSHPIGTRPRPDPLVDIQVKNLLELTLTGLPAAYVLLMYIAEQILAHEDVFNELNPQDSNEGLV